MKKLFTLCLLFFSLSSSAQWQLTGARVRYVNGLGIPTRDTAAGVAADSSQIVIRPADSALYVKYKRTWLRVGGTGFTGSGTTNYVPKFTSSTAIGNSQIFDNGTFVGVNKTTLSGSYVLQVNGGIQSTSAGLPFQFHSTSNVNYNSFFSNNTTLFGAIGNYTGLISGGVPGDKRDSIFTTLSVNDMSFATGGAFERVRLTTGGQLNVGGQFTQTTNALNVVGNIVQVNALAGVQTALKTVVTSMTLLTANGAVGTETPHDLALITANTTRANLTSSGQFNIGGNYASTNNTLQVAGNAAIGYTTAAPTNGLIVNGSVGVGTSSPAYSLHVNGTLGVTGTALFRPLSGINVLFQDNSGAFRMNFLNNAQSANIPAQFIATHFTWQGSTGSGVMALTSGGNLQLTNANPQIDFITNTTTTATMLSIIGAQFVGSAPFNANRITAANSSHIALEAGGSERLRVKSDGEVLVQNTDNGAYNLQCNGTGVWGAGAYVNGSDSALKENIIAIDSSLQYVKLLKPVTYKYKKFYSSDSTIQTGFIAQDLQKVFKGKPLLDGLVKQGGKYLSVAYQNLIPLLTKAIQEQQTKIESLEARIAAIEAILKSNKIQ